MSETFRVTLRASGRHFDVAAGETVLEAATRSGIVLPYGCHDGTCGDCQATLLEGRCRLADGTTVDADELAVGSGRIALCQAAPLSNLLIDVREHPSVIDIAPRQLDVVVAQKWALAPDVVGIRLLPAPGERGLQWLHGQYLEVLLDDGGRRPFSIANGPNTEGFIELHVRQTATGGFTNWVYDHLKVGDRLRIEGPQGTFVAREGSDRPLLFMAGGTGFAPVKALIEHFLAIDTPRPIVIYWGARSAADLYLREMAQAWSQQARRLRFHPVVSDVAEADNAQLRAGLVHEALLQDHPQLDEYDVYMSGPPAMIEAGRTLFIAAGLPEERLYYDAFGYAPDLLAQILASRANGYLR